MLQALGTDQTHSVGASISFRSEPEEDLRSVLKSPTDTPDQEEIGYSVGYRWRPISDQQMAVVRWNSIHGLCLFSYLQKMKWGDVSGLVGVRLLCSLATLQSGACLAGSFVIPQWKCKITARWLSHKQFAFLLEGKSHPAWDWSVYSHHQGNQTSFGAIVNYEGQ